MSETTDTGTAAPAEPQYGEPVSKSDTSTPNNLGGGNDNPEPEPEAKPEPKDDKPKPRDWREDRIRQQSARIAAEARRADQTAQERDELRRELEALKNPGGTHAANTPTKIPDPQDFDRAVQERAEIVAEQKAFNDDCNKVATQGSTEFTDFHPTMKTLWDATDGLDNNGALTPRAVSLIEAALETDKPHAVLYHLGQNPEEAIRIAALKSDAKRGAAIAKVAAGLSAAAATPRPVSRAPAPLEPVSGTVRAEVGPQGPKDIKAWMEWRDEQAKAARGQ